VLAAWSTHRVHTKFESGHSHELQMLCSTSHAWPLLQRSTLRLGYVLERRLRVEMMWYGWVLLVGYCLIHCQRPLQAAQQAALIKMLGMCQRPERLTGSNWVLAAQCWYKGFYQRECNPLACAALIQGQESLQTIMNQMRLHSSHVTRKALVQCHGLPSNAHTKQPLDKILAKAGRSI